MDENAVILKYTYNGDANLDGRINSDDYFRIDSGFLAQPAVPTYRQGDFNYDGRVDSDDHFLIDGAFLGQAGVMSSRAVSAVPRATTPFSDNATIRTGEHTPILVRRKPARPVRSLLLDISLNRRE